MVTCLFLKIDSRLFAWTRADDAEPSTFNQGLDKTNKSHEELLEINTFFQSLQKIIYHQEVC